MLSTLLALVSAGVAGSDTDNRAPEVPSTLAVPDGYKVSFHVYATGFQSYMATTSPTDPATLVWTFTGPQAILMDSEGEMIGVHYAYAGPSRPAWESQSGSVVVAARSVPPVTVDPTAVPWLLLDGIQSEGPGIFEGTAYIQRVNTTGGLQPAVPPTHLGQEARVPYTAEYYFYRARG